MADFPSFSPDGDQKIVYVRDVKTSELPEPIQAQTGGQDRVYAIHAESGEVLALVDDWKAAFVLARRNEMAPFSAH
ncbi:MAG: DUF1150 family protein [Pseudomonadota bacterium]